MTTMRSRRVSRDRYTSAIPPAPSCDWISYGPSFVPDVSAIPGRNVPGARAIRARNYSLRMALRPNATIPDRLSVNLT
jgi:hypothetical protein